MSTIYLPEGQGQLYVPGRGLVSSHIIQAQDAVREYESDLELARNEQTGDWTVFHRRGPEGSPFPVFSLGRELPAPERIKEMLASADVKRRGREIIDRIRTRREAAQLAAKKESSDRAGEVAEVAEWALRKMGQTSHKRVYLSGRKAPG